MVYFVESSKGRSGRVSVGGSSLLSAGKKRRRRRGQDGSLLPLSPEKAKAAATPTARGRGGSVAGRSGAKATPAVTPVPKRAYRTRRPKVVLEISPEASRDDTDLFDNDATGKRGSAVDALSRLQVRAIGTCLLVVCLFVC